MARSVKLLASLAVICAFLVGCGPTATSTDAPNAGTVRFGSAIDSATLTLVGPEKQSFRQDERLAYVAVLSEPANAASLRLVIAKLNGTTETGLVDQPISVSNPTFQVVANELAVSDLLGFLDGPGSYVLRVLRDATVLAQGTFVIN